jgi:hypothetical protein
MRVVTASGENVELGITEATPTIGITDYSRRVTDDFGVTTVVPRSFSRRLSVKLALPFGNADGLQQRLAALRATSALWIADERFSWLRVQGYYKDFSLDLAVAPISLCTLTIEGLAEGGDFSDPGGDPAPDNRASSLRLLQPVPVTDAVLTNSTVAENDYPAWSASQSYAAGTRVIKVGTHRIYESTRAGNLGNDPAGASGAWLDLAPTKRWAMFDQALGTATSGAGSIAVTLAAGAVNAVSLLDVVASSVRVQAAGYDRTLPAGAGAITFLDLPDVATPVTVTITGRGTVSVGTLLIGRVVGLGLTESSPTAGITDYSRKATDDFGEVTVVERAWAKRMTTAAALRTDALDLVASRIASVRAKPSLWIGQAGVDSLTIYGFFKDFSIEVGDTISKLSLSVEGLSQAAPIAPGGLGEPTAWPDVTDPTGTKPTDNADKTSENTSKDTNAVGGVPAGQVLARQDAIETVTIPAINAAVAQANERIIAAQDNAYAAVAAANDRIAAAQGKLDQAVLDLATEIDRARGADEDLTRRVDAIMAGGSGPGEADITALIERIDLVRADGERSLASAIQNVVTAYQGLDTATNTRITQQVAALSDADRSIGQRIDSVQVDYRGLNTNTNVRITDSVKALADADQAIGERIDQLIASGGGGSEGVDTIARTEISRVETASADRDGALGRRIDSVQSSFKEGGGNGLTNTDFVTLDGWTQAYGGLTSLNGGINLAGDNYHPLGENTIGVQQGPRVGTDANYLDWQSSRVPVRAGDYVQFHAQCASHRASTQVVLVFIDSSGVTVDISYGNINTSTEAYANDPASFRRSGMASVKVPDGVAAAYLLLRKGNTYEGQGDSYAWFWRPYVGAAREGQSSWNAWSPGSGRAVQARSDAAITQAATTAANAGQAVADLTTSVTTRFEGVNLTLGGYDQRITALSTDQQGYVGRTSTLEAQMRREQPSALNAFTDAVNNRLTQVDTAVNARIKTSEDVIADLPNRYAAASRTATLEAQLRREVGSPLNDAIGYVDGRVDTSAVQLAARIEERATAIADAKAGAVAQTVQQLQAQYNGDIALIRETSGAIAGINQRTSVYWEVVGTTNDGSTMVRLSKQDGSRGVFYIGADLQVDGNALFNGTVTTSKVAGNAITSTVAIAGMSGSGISAENPGETPRVSITSVGGTMKVDIQADGARQGGAGLMRVQLFAAYAGTETALSREVSFSPSNTALPVGFFQITSFPAGMVVQFFLRFYVTAGNTSWTFTGAAIAVTEFKR